MARPADAYPIEQCRELPEGYEESQADADTAHTAEVAGPEDAPHGKATNYSGRVETDPNMDAAHGGSPNYDPRPTYAPPNDAPHGLAANL